MKDYAHFNICGGEYTPRAKVPVISQMLKFIKRGGGNIDICGVLQSVAEDLWGY